MLIFAETVVILRSLKDYMVEITQSNVFSSKMLVAFVKVIFHNLRALFKKCAVKEFQVLFGVAFFAEVCPCFLQALPKQCFC